MKARNKLAESTTPDGAPMALYEHDGHYSISFQGQELMHSDASSELRWRNWGEQLDPPELRVC